MTQPRQRLTGRHRRGLLTLLTLLVPMVAACGGGHDAPRAIPHPTGHHAVVLRIGESAGFGTTEGAFTTPPVLVVTGDGTTYLRKEEATTTGIVWPLVSFRVDEDELQALLHEADHDGLLAAPPDYAPPEPVADAGDTTVGLVAAGGRWTHVANALGDVRDDTAARTRLAGFVDYAERWARGPRRPRAADVRPAALRMMAHPLPEGSTPPNGRVGRWPPDAPVDLADVGDCAVVRDPALVRLLTTGQAYAYTQAGQRYVVAAAVLLPGDSCSG